MEVISIDEKWGTGNEEEGEGKASCNEEVGKMLSCDEASCEASTCEDGI